MLTSHMPCTPMQNGPLAELHEQPQELQQQFARLADLPPGSETGKGTTTDDGKGDDPPAADDDAPGKEDDDSGDETDPEVLKADRDKWRNLSKKNEKDYKAAEADAKKWREHQRSQQTDDERRAEQDAELAAERDDAVRENALLKLGIKHKLDEDSIQEITELLEGVPADKFGERAERLAARLAKNQGDGEGEQRKAAPDRLKGRETPPAGNASGDFLRDAFRR